MQMRTNLKADGSLMLRIKEELDDALNALQKRAPKLVV
jgi:hypothetical protein